MVGVGQSENVRHAIDRRVLAMPPIDENAVGLYPVDGTKAAVLRAFMAFLATDIHAHPERITSVSPELRARIKALTAGLDVDLDAPIEGTVALTDGRGPRL